MEHCKIDRLRLMFFWKHVLKLDWQWLDIVKPPKVKSIPDILTPREVERLICSTKKLRYQVFLLTTYSMGLRLTEALSLQVSDIDSERKLVHIRRGKGCKDRMVPLPDRTLYALRVLCSKHRHQTLIFPNAKDSLKTIQQATTHMNIGGDHATSQWIDKQQMKLLPVMYFMVTFTLPRELRSLVYHQQKITYSIFFDSIVSTLKTFGLNPKHLGAEIGATMVLHTNSRRLDFHPHIHAMVAGGGVDKRSRRWKSVRNDYLFNHKALAKVFRARFLAGLIEAGLTLPEKIPRDWVVDCSEVGKGISALKYLSRYLYRGVISEGNIVSNENGFITFKYIDSDTGETEYRNLKGEDFLQLIAQHVLPRGFRRVRDYGFLHSNAKRLRSLIQLILRIIIPPINSRPRPAFKCSCCKSDMVIWAFRRYAERPG